MAELEDKVVEPETQVEVVEDQEEVSYSPFEQKARSQGWVSEEEWVDNGGDPEEWVDARTFNLRGELFGKIKQLNKQLDEHRNVIHELRNHNIEITKKENDKLKRQLKAQKEKAIEEGNGKVVNEIDDWLSELNSGEIGYEAQQGQGTQVDGQALQNQFNDWVTQNTWYNSDDELREEADSIGIAEAIKLTKNQRQLSPSEASEVYEKVTKKIRKMYPEKFQNPNKSRPSSVSSSNSSSAPKGPKSKYTMKDVPEQYREIAKKFERTGALSVDEYCKQLKSMGEI